MENTLTKLKKTLLLLNHKANFNQTWHKASLNEGDSSLFNEGPHPFPRRDNYEIAKIHWQNIKILFSRTTEPISTKLGTKHPWVKGIKFCSKKNHLILIKIINVFFSYLNQYYDIIMYLLIWTVFSGERCGPWASCF